MPRGVPGPLKKGSEKATRRRSRQDRGVGRRGCREVFGRRLVILTAAREGRKDPVKQTGKNWSPAGSGQDRRACRRGCREGFLHASAFTSLTTSGRASAWLLRPSTFSPVAMRLRLRAAASLATKSSFRIRRRGPAPVSRALPFGSDPSRSAPLKVAALRTAQTTAAEETDHVASFAPRR